MYCSVMCDGLGHTAGQLMCVGGRNGCSSLQGKRTNLETSRVACPLICENLSSVGRVPFMLSKKREKSSSFLGRLACCAFCSTAIPTLLSTSQWLVSPGSQLGKQWNIHCEPLLYSLLSFQVDTISINHNWINGFGIYHMWRHIHSELQLVSPGPGHSVLGGINVVC